jgi:hypothetical protein
MVLKSRCNKSLYTCSCRKLKKSWSIYRPITTKLLNIENVLTRLHDAGLKVNATKSLLCTHKFEYLGYILTREGIKPQPKKVQMILALNPTNNIKKLRHFLGMVPYYRMRGKSIVKCWPLSQI